MRRCLDTTFITRALRSEESAVAVLNEWGRGGDSVATTEINFFEVAVGIERTASKRERERISRAWVEVLTHMDVLPLTRRATMLAVRRQAALYAAGRPAAVADLLIAACARIGGCESIVTRDEEDYRRIDLLAVETH